MAAHTAKCDSDEINEVSIINIYIEIDINVNYIDYVCNSNK